MLIGAWLVVANLVSMIMNCYLIMLALGCYPLHVNERLGVRLIMEYIFLVNLFRDINIDIIFYNLAKLK